MIKPLKYMILTFLILGLFLISGCAQDSVQRGGVAFIGGTTGLSIEMVSGQPPSSIYKGDQFGITIKVENLGEYDVAQNDAEFRISGIDPNEFGNPNLIANPSIDLESRKKDAEGVILPGGIDFISFEGFVYTGDAPGNQRYNLKVGACYSYGTRATTLLCYRENLRKEYQSGDICRVEEIKQLSVSGAPVKVENLRQYVRSGEKIGFSFDIKAAGQGTVSRHNSDCDDSFDNEDMVWVSVDTGRSGLSCSGLEGGTSGYVRLYDGKRTIICDQDAQVDNDFERTVNIELKYDYFDFITSELLVKYTEG